MLRPRIATALLSALALLGVVTAPRSSRAAEPFTINVILPETGAAAFLGKEEAQSLQTIQTMVNRTGGINGQPIAFAIVDDQSTPQVSVQLFNTILAKKPAVILGPSFVSTCSAIAPLAQSAGPVDYCFSPGIHPAAGSYVFSASPSTRSLLEVAERFFHERGWTKIAVITSTDATGQDADRGIKAAFEAPGSGEQVVDWEHFTPGDVSTTAQMAHIQNSGAQAMIAWSTGTPFATVLRGANGVGLSIPMLTTSGNLTYAQMQQYAPFMTDQLYFSGFPWVSPESVKDPQVKRAVDAFVAAFKASGVKPDVGQSLAWDPALIVIDAYRHLGTGATATQIRDYLDGIGPAHPYAGIYGRVQLQGAAAARPRRQPSRDGAVGSAESGLGRRKRARRRADRRVGSREMTARAAFLAALGAGAAGLAAPRPAFAQAAQCRMAGVFSDLFAEPFYVDAAGAFAKAGFTTSATSLANAGAVAAAIGGGALELGTGDLISGVNAIIKGVPILLVAGGGLYRESEEGQNILAVANDSPIKTPEGHDRQDDRRPDAGRAHDGLSARLAARERRAERQRETGRDRAVGGRAVAAARNAGRRPARRAVHHVLERAIPDGRVSDEFGRRSRRRASSSASRSGTRTRTGSSPTAPARAVRSTRSTTRRAGRTRTTMRRSTSW